MVNIMLEEYLKTNNYEYELEASLKKYNTYRIDAKVKYLVFPQSKEELINIIKEAKKNNIEFTIIGGGSNIIFAKEYYDRLFINLSKLNNIELKDNTLIVDAGVPTIKAANYAIDNSKDGLVFATGIPGTIGGAAVVNAGCYGSSMSEVVQSVTILTEDYQIKELTNEELHYEYRNSILKNTKNIVLEVKINLTDGNKEEMTALKEERREKRVASQPLDKPSAGSAFRNPEGNYAGKLIEDAGLKGFKVNDAEVSTKHANFIINNGNATGKDILDLINIIQTKVKETSGIDLYLEQLVID
jgi:UDP-N-acetylmuramate dehydrogenase